MILSGRLASADETQRFRREAEAAANLDHPNIVPIYEVGEHDGPALLQHEADRGRQPGRTQLGRFRADPRAAARLLATVARAVHYAHQRGILHRDLKPSNILLDARRPAPRHRLRPGQAGRGGQHPDASRGAILGTPSYMAPEQASGDGKGLTTGGRRLRPRGDPLRAADRPAALPGRDGDGDGRPGPGARAGRRRGSSTGGTRDLETICLRCLEKSASDRYPSAAELAEALDQYLRGEDVAATSVRKRLRRWLRREPGAGLAARRALDRRGLLSQYNYTVGGRSDPRLHYTVQAVLALWALSSALFQFLLRRGHWPEPARCCPGRRPTCSR